MVIIIDGYNLLKQLRTGAVIDEHDRSWFIAKMSTYQAIKQHTITIIFDGGPCTYPSQCIENGLLVQYSGRNQSADYQIKVLIVQQKGSDCLLVSSDNDLCRYASEYQIASIDSVWFWRIALSVLHQGEKSCSRMMHDHEVIVKQSSECNAYLDELMMQASTMSCAKEEDDPFQYEDFSCKKTKQERVEIEIIKRLS